MTRRKTSAIMRVPGVMPRPVRAIIRDKVRLATADPDGGQTTPLTLLPPTNFRYILMPATTSPISASPVSDTRRKHLFMPLDKIDRFLMSTIITVLMLTVGISLWDNLYFSLKFAAEDGAVEYGTAIALLIASIILVKNALALRGKASKLAVGLTFFYALLFFFGAGEEVSWGQRIFGWETSEALKELNKQDETNLHNLEIGGLHLAKTLFGPVLTVAILLYLAVLPWLYSRSSRVRNIANKFAVPVPGLRHAVLAILSSLVIVAVDSLLDVSRVWEVYEFIFSLLVVSIFLLPTNRDKVT